MMNLIRWIKAFLTDGFYMKSEKYKSDVDFRPHYNVEFKKIKTLWEILKND